MNLNFLKNTSFILVLVCNLTLFYSCAQEKKTINNEENTNNKQKETTNLKPELSKTNIPAANHSAKYLPLLQGKNVGIVANQTSVIFKQPNNVNSEYTHVVDSLLTLKINITKVFAPEHGFRGNADAGEVVKDGKDTRTGLPILSLYGKNKKPSTEQLAGIDIMVFDIQDVGARFYTYISTLHYIMEACAENNIPLLILDRPNPNGHYIDGPILEKEHTSFVGMHPVPIVHGMTIGEYAQMINGEQWLKNGAKCNLHIIPATINNTNNVSYHLPIKPSPNLPNDHAINLYPSLCLFEGTNVSVGRGTNLQFQVVGTPEYRIGDFQFTPQPNEGAKYPKHESKTCYGLNLSDYNRLSEINLDWLIDAYQKHHAAKIEAPFFNAFFTKLAGTKKLQEQIEAGWSSEKIKETWKKDLKDYDAMRKQYLLY